MIKVTNNAFVFKFVGGEPELKRTCHYCHKEKLGGMICVYSNANDYAEDAGLFICPKCAVQGCRESEQQWSKLYKAAKKRGKAIPTCAAGGPCDDPGGCDNPVKLRDSSGSH